jgi:uncharacterized protein YjbI with pentapeptide repeats
MGPFVENNEAIQWLRDRWKGDLVNRIVIALNEGREIQSVLGEVPQNPEVPSVAGRIDLRGINLSHQNLRGPWEIKGEERVRVGVNLRDVDLAGAILNWVILPRADLRGAILKDVDLRNAELIYSDLSDADLTGAEMQGAWLLETKFYGAKITEEQLKSRRNLGQLDFDYLAYEI